MAMALARAADNPDEPRYLLIGGPGYVTEVQVDEETLTITNNLALPGALPSWMCWYGKGVYIVDENSQLISWYTFDKHTNALTKKGWQCGSTGVVHVNGSNASGRLLGASYGEGQVDVWDISSPVDSLKHGSLNLMKQIACNNHSAVGSKKTSRPHQVVPDPRDGRFIVVNDLGTDTILVIDSKDDKFAVTNRVPVLPTGCGPRHGAFYPTQRDVVKRLGHAFYLVVCENSNELLVYKTEWTAHSLYFQLLQTVSTYGQDFPPADASSAAAGGILIIPRRQTRIGDVYVTNRRTGHETDNISHFEFNTTTQSIEFKDCVSTRGKMPRSLCRSIAGTTVFVANMGGEVGIAAYSRDANTGVLDPTPIAEAPNSMFNGGIEGNGPQFITEIVPHRLLAE